MWGWKAVVEWMRGDVHQSVMLAAMSGGVVIGGILTMVFRVRMFGALMWLCLAVVLMIFAFLCPKRVLVMVAVVVGMIMVNFRAADGLRDREYVEQFYGHNVLVRGVVAGDPESDEKDTKFTLGDLLFGEGEGREAGGSLYVKVSLNKELKRGDGLVLGGKMMEGFGSYSGYLYRPKIEEWERAKNGDMMLMARDWFSERVRQVVPEPEVDLGLSYLMGIKAGLMDETKEDLRTVGLMHIVVASGAHLGIVVLVVRRALGRVSKKAEVVAAIGLTGCFMWMVGWTPSIMRAGLMVILILWVGYFGRRIAAWRLMLLVAALTIMIEPMVLFELSFLLSFASCFGIMVLQPVMVRFFCGRKKPGFVGGVVLTTLAASAMTLPIGLYYYGAVSLIAVVANLLILPTLSVAMGLVFLAGVCAGVPGVETVVGKCASFVLDLHLMAVDRLGEMRELVIEVPKNQGWVYGLYAIILVVWVGMWWYGRRRRLR